MCDIINSREFPLKSLKCTEGERIYVANKYNFQYLKINQSICDLLQNVSLQYTLSYGQAAGVGEEVQGVQVGGKIHVSRGVERVPFTRNKSSLY